MSPYYSQTVPAFLGKTMNGRCHFISHFLKMIVTKSWYLWSVNFRPGSLVSVLSAYHHFGLVAYHLLLELLYQFPTCSLLLPSLFYYGVLSTKQSEESCLCSAKTLRLFSISLRVKSKSFHWSRGAEYMIPKYAALACGLFWAEGKQDPADSRKNFYLSLHYPKEFGLGAWLRERAITRDNFYLNDLSVWQGKHLITKHLLWLPWELLSSTLKSQAPVPFLRSDGV